MNKFVKLSQYLSEYQELDTIKYGFKFDEIYEVEDEINLSGNLCYQFKGFSYLWSVDYFEVCND